MIIINADDFGLNERCSTAIALAFERGLVTDTTIMATGEYFDRAVALAEERGFSDCIGIHLNLTEGVPLTAEIASCPGFVTDGRFNKSYDQSRELTGDEARAIYAELSAQIERLLAAGIEITHADSHHYIHNAAYIAPIVQQVCKEYGINKLRLRRDLCAYSDSERIAVQSYNDGLRAQGFITADHFGKLIDIEDADLPDNTEILVHPDLDKDGSLTDRTGMADGFPTGKPIPDLRAERGIITLGYKYLK